MSTRGRIVLTNTKTGDSYKGSQAVALMVGQSIAKQILSIDFPANWKKMLKSQKLKFLCQYLSKEWQLKIIQEPRHTRKKKSLYWKTYKDASKKKAGEDLMDDEYVPLGLRPAVRERDAQQAFFIDVEAQPVRPRANPQPQLNDANYDAIARVLGRR